MLVMIGLGGEKIQSRLHCGAMTRALAIGSTPLQGSSFRRRAGHGFDSNCWLIFECRITIDSETVSQQYVHLIDLLAPLLIVGA